jgi:hypothetical protein
MPTLMQERFIHQGSNLRLLEELLIYLQRQGLEEAACLFRSSEAKERERILTYGTDRGGYAIKKLWDYADETGLNFLHEEVIIATTAEEIRRGEREPEFSSSFKKFIPEEKPLVLIYDVKAFEKIREKHYRFLDPDQKHSALLAIFDIQMT